MVTQPNWNLEFDRIVEAMRKAWFENKIQDFLQWHLRLNQLFTHKLQSTIDNKDHITHEYKFNIPNEVLKKIDDFNNNFQSLQNEITALKLDALKNKEKDVVKDGKESKRI